MSTSPLAAAADRWGDRLPRRLGLWSAVAVLVGSTIGGGIFRTPAIIAERVPAPLPMFGVWILGGLLALCGALTYAELAALFPRSGGVYVYIREGFGRLPAFLFGWTELLLIRASALGAISTPFAEYLLRSLGLDPKIEPNASYVHYVAAGAIVVTATLNYVGVRWSSLILNLTTATKYGALALLVALAFVVGQGDFAHFTQAAGTPTAGLFGLSLVSVLWAYDGWGDLSFVGGEVRDPERNLPRALQVALRVPHFTAHERQVAPAVVRPQHGHEGETEQARGWRARSLCEMGEVALPHHECQGHEQRERPILGRRGEIQNQRAPAHADVVQRRRHDDRARGYVVDVAGVGLDLRVEAERAQEVLGERRRDRAQSRR